jgi:hypothetical protein
MTSHRLLLALVTTCLATGCEPTIFGSDSLVTLTPTFEDFDRLELSNEVRATVIAGPERRVKITINENLQDHLIVRGEGNRVRVGMQEGFDYHRLTLEVEATLPSLAAIDLAGASQAALTGFGRSSVPRFEARVSGASRLEGDVAADRVTLELSGASRADLGGLTRELVLEASGASHAGLDDLAAQVASVELSGASHANVLVQNEVHGEASGASELLVRGGAVTNVATSGASSVTRR